MSSVATTRPQGRIVSLDGLRGVAALVVVLNHSLLTVPVFASLGVQSSSSVGGAWWFVFTPLHIVWAGGEAVFVFFVLSGVVLTLPVLKNRRFSWLAYYPTRAVRIYVPVILALLFTLATVALVPRTIAGAHGAWAAAHVEPVTVATVVRDAFLLKGVDSLNTPLWSLQWEVIFSIILPLYVLLSVKLRRFGVLLMFGALACVLVGALTGKPWLTLLPMFALGTVIAVHRERILTFAERFRTSQLWWVLLAVSTCALTSRWWLAWAPLSVTSGAQALEAAGAVSAVIMAMAWPRAQRLLNQRIVQWLGTISFSLYLTHEPVVVAVSFLLPVAIAWLTPFIAVPLSLGIGWGFYRFAESPSHRLAQSISRVIKSRAVAATRPTGFPQLGD